MSQFFFYNHLNFNISKIRKNQEIVQIILGKKCIKDFIFKS